MIERKYATDLDLDALAREIATSRRQLQRVFAEVGGTSFREYLAKVRMRHAARLLREGAIPVREVAQSVGYRQPAQFAKAFRRHHGTPPSSLRGPRRQRRNGHGGRVARSGGALPRGPWNRLARRFPSTPEEQRPAHQKHPLARMLLIGVIASVIGVLICLQIDWFPSQGSTQAEQIDTLYDVLLIVSVPVFVLVMTVAIYSVIAFRAKPGDQRRRRAHPRQHEARGRVGDDPVHDRLGARDLRLDRARRHRGEEGRTSSS